MKAYEILLILLFLFAGFIMLELIGQTKQSPVQATEDPTSLPTDSVAALETPCADSLEILRDSLLVLQYERSMAINHSVALQAQLNYSD